MTRDELNNSNDANILAAGKVTKARHSNHNDNIADYIDELQLSGIVTRSGNGATTVFSVLHSMAPPYSVHITPASIDAMGSFYVSSAGGDLLAITFETAPPSGTDNVVFYYLIKQIPS